MATSTESPTSTPSRTAASLVSAPARNVRLTVGVMCSPGRQAPSTVQISVTVSRFCVSVPVLSLRITVVDPSVSTAGRCRTIARRRAICDTPTLNATVSTMGSDSGTEATASATAVRTISPGAYPPTTPATNTKKIAASRATTI